MEINNQRGGGISFIGLLTLVFITLKLCDVIDWSWWWILSPILFLIFIVVVLLIAGFMAYYKWHKDE